MTVCPSIPKSHYVMPRSTVLKAIRSIKEELELVAASARSAGQVA